MTLGRSVNRLERGGRRELLRRSAFGLHQCYEVGWLEVLRQLHDAAEPLLELGSALEGAHRFGVFPLADADEPARVAEVAHEPDRPVSGVPAYPLRELRPRLDERMLVLRLHLEATIREDLVHQHSLTVDPMMLAQGRADPRVDRHQARAEREEDVRPARPCARGV